MPASTASTISIACRAPIVGPPPTGTIRRSTFPSAASCASRRARLAEVAEVRHAHLAEQERQQRVRPALGARHVVVLGGDPDDLADRRLVRPRGRPQHHGIAADGADAVVVPVLVGDEQQVGGDALDGRVLPAHPAVPQRREIVEGIDEDGGVAVGSRKADCPYHSSCMLLLCDSAGLEARLATAGSASATRGVRPPRSRRAAATRHASMAKRTPRAARRGTARRSGSGRTCGRSRPPGCARHRGEDLRVDQVLHRVVAEEGGEEDRHRRRSPTDCAVAAGTPLASGPRPACGGASRRARRSSA